MIVLYYLSLISWPLHMFKKWFFLSLH